MKSRLVLASSSPYRRELLSRLGLHFECASPNLDESPLPGESVSGMVERLSQSKAAALRARFLDHIIIGSDQAAELSGACIGKPGTPEAAKSQLLAAAGKTLVFHTGLCVLDSATGHYETVMVPTTVEFRRYSEREIERYLELEPALDCAGSFKSEGLGISLCGRITSDDPTALIGLPLVALNKLLARFGANPLD